MDFTLSKQQQMVQKMYREFAENEVKPLAKKVDAEEYFPKETVEKMGKLGMMGIYFPHFRWRCRRRCPVLRHGS